MLQVGRMAIAIYFFDFASLISTAKKLFHFLDIVFVCSFYCIRDEISFGLVRIFAPWGIVFFSVVKCFVSNVVGNLHL